MPAENNTWLTVIGKSLAYMCLKSAEREDPERFGTILAKVKFLEGLGLPRDAAAEAVGSSAASVAELIRQAKMKKAKVKTNGTVKKSRG